MSHTQAVVQKQNITHQRVIVIGAAGFIGSHIVKLLIENYHAVMAVDDDSVAAQVRLEKITQQIIQENDCGASLESTNICLADAKEVQDLMRYYKPTAIINAYTCTREEREKGYLPGMSIKEVVVQANIINAIQECRKMNVVYISSDEVYGSKFNGEPAVEYNLALQPESQYGVLKKTAEQLLTQSVVNNPGINATILRTSSVYGPGGTPQDSVINSFLEAHVNEKTLTVYGDGSVIRDFVFVTDVAEMAIIAVLRGLHGIFNASTGIETSISQLIEYIKRVVEIHSINYLERKSGEVSYKCLHPTYGREQTGIPVTDLAIGIAKTYKEIDDRILENMVLH